MGGLICLESGECSHTVGVILTSVVITTTGGPKRTPNVATIVLRRRQIRINICHCRTANELHGRVHSSLVIISTLPFTQCRKIPLLAVQESMRRTCFCRWRTCDSLVCISSTLLDNLLCITDTVII